MDCTNIAGAKEPIAPMLNTPLQYSTCTTHLLETIETLMRLRLMRTGMLVVADFEDHPFKVGNTTCTQ